MSASLEDRCAFTAKMHPPHPRPQPVARWTWHEINLPNVRQHVVPTLERADVVVHTAADHTVERVEQRR